MGGFTQGSAWRATLGCVAESRWDSTLRVLRVRALEKIDGDPATVNDWLQ